MPYKYDKNKRNNAMTYTNLDTKAMCIRRAEAEILINTL